MGQLLRMSSINGCDSVFRETVFPEMIEVKLNNNSLTDREVE
jgi:hypothetical protein